MPGHIGTSIGVKGNLEIDEETGAWVEKTHSPADIERMKTRYRTLLPPGTLDGKSDAEIGALMQQLARDGGQAFKDGGTAAEDAAAIIIRGVRARLAMGDAAILTETDSNNRKISV